jgi:hypothetical protein
MHNKSVSAFLTLTCAGKHNVAITNNLPACTAHLTNLLPHTVDGSGCLTTARLCVVNTSRCKPVHKLPARHDVSSFGARSCTLPCVVLARRTPRFLSSQQLGGGCSALRLRRGCASKEELLRRRALTRLFFHGNVMIWMTMSDQLV